MNKNNKKILLGITGSFGKKNKDTFLDIELKQNFNEIRPEKYDNDFDIQKEFDKQRESSRNFVLYGFVNSIFDIPLDGTNTIDNQIIATQAQLSTLQSQVFNDTENSLQTIITDETANYNTMVAVQNSTPNPSANLAAYKQQRFLYWNHLIFLDPSEIDALVEIDVINQQPRYNQAKANADAANAMLQNSIAAKIAYENSFVDPYTIIVSDAETNYNMLKTIQDNTPNPQTDGGAYRDSRITFYLFDPSVDQLHFGFSPGAIDLANADTQEQQQRYIQAKENADAAKIIWQNILPPQVAFNNGTNAINNLSAELAHEITLQTNISNAGTGVLQLWIESQSATTPSDQSLSIVSYVAKNTIVITNGSILTYDSDISLTPTKYESGNIFEAKTMKYYKELNNFTTSETVYILINGSLLTTALFPNGNPDYIVPNKLLKQKLVFRNDVGTIIPYGTSAEELNSDGTTFTVDNDFPFFYNTHWIKNYINMEIGYIPSISFGTNSLNLTEGQTRNIPLILSREVTLDGTSATFYVDTNFTTASSSDYSFPQTVNIPKGSTSASLPVTASNVLSSTASLLKIRFVTSSAFLNRLNVNDFVDVKLKSTQVAAQSENYANFFISSSYRNLQSFDIYTDDPEFPLFTDHPNLGKSVLRNGMKFVSTTIEGANNSGAFYVEDGFSTKDPNSFYPNDFYTIRVINKGQDVIYPDNSSLSNTSFTFHTNEYVDINVNQTYNATTPVHALGMMINSIDITDILSIDINGTIYSNISSTNDLLTALANDTSNKTFDFYKASGWQSFANSPGATRYDFIYLVSKVAGIPVAVRNLVIDDIFAATIGVTFFTSNDSGRFNGGVSIGPINDPSGAIVSVNDISFVDFEDVPQNPVKISLLANSSDAKHSQYDFVLKKPGYKDIMITSQNWSTLFATQDLYLETGYSNMLVPYDAANSSCVFSDATGDQPLASGDILLQTSDAYVNGVLFVSDKASDSTQSIFAQFNPNPMTPISCTASVDQGNQMGGLKITP